MEIVKSSGGLFYAYVDGKKITGGFGNADLATQAGQRVLDHSS